MRLFATSTAILFALALAIPALAQNKWKKTTKGASNGGKNEITAGAAKKNLKWGLVFSGKLIKLAHGRMTVKISARLKVIRADAAKRVAEFKRSVANFQRDLTQRKLNLKRIQANIAKAPNAVTRARLKEDYLRELRRAPPRSPQPPQIYRTETKTAEVSLRMAKDMIVRSSAPEKHFDEKGRPIKLAPEKLQQKRGPEGYPGFSAGLGDLAVDMQVKVYLAAMSRKKKEWKKGPFLDDILRSHGPAGQRQNGVLADTRIPEVVMIMIMQIPAAENGN